MQKLFTLLAIMAWIGAKAQFQFDMPGASATYVTGINDSGYICGYYLLASNGNAAGFFYNGKDTVLIDEAKTGYVNNYCSGINNRGLVVGYHNTGSSTNSLGFEYGWRTDLLGTETITGYTNIVVNDIDDSDNISGQCSNGIDKVFFAQGPTQTPVFLQYSYLGTMYPSYGGYGHLGDQYTTGYYIDGITKHGFIYNSGFSPISHYTWIELTGTGGQIQSEVFGINNQMHVIVQVSGTKSYICTNVSDPANNLIPITINHATAVHATKINNTEYVCGSFTGTDGIEHGFYERVYDIGFRPKTSQIEDGDDWRFANVEDELWPTSEYPDTYVTDPYNPHSLDWKAGKNAFLPKFASWPLFVRTFGEANCYLTDHHGAKHVKPLAQFIWSFNLKNWKGSCFGMSSTAITRYDRKDIFESRFPDLVSSVATGDYLAGHYPIDACNQIQIAQDSKLYDMLAKNAANAGFDANFSLLKSAMADTTSTRHHLVLSITNETLVGFPLGAHAVVPFRIEKDTIHNNGDEWIDIYDPNHPGDQNRKIVVSTPPNASGFRIWKYQIGDPHGSTPATFWGTVGITDTTRGRLFVMDPWPAMQGYQEAVPSHEPLPANPVVRSSTNQIIVAFSDSTEYLITDQANDTTCYYNNMTMNNIPDAFGLIDYTGGPSHTSSFMLDQGNTYTVKLRTHNDGRMGTVMEIDSANMLAFTIDSSNDADINQATFSDGIAYANPGATKRIVHFDAVVASNYFYSLSNIPVAQNESVKVAPADSTDLWVTNTGTATSYQLDMNVEVGSSVILLHFDSVFFHANSSHLVVPHFDSLSTSGIWILVDTTGNGTHIDTVFYQNQTTPYLDLSKRTDSLSFAAGADTLVVSNLGGGTLTWNVAYTSPWITVQSGNSGSQGGQIAFSYTANASSPRNGIIVVEATGATNSPDTVFISQDGATAVNPMYDDNNEIVIYPNPFKDKLFIRRTGSASDDAKIAIYDVNGQLLKEVELGAGQTQAEVSMTELSSGIYLIRSKGAKSVTTGKFVKY